MPQATTAGTMFDTMMTASTRPPRKTMKEAASVKPPRRYRDESHLFVRIASGVMATLMKGNMTATPSVCISADTKLPMKSTAAWARSRGVKTS